MDTSLLQQPLTANTALEWLRNSLDASESIQPESSQEWVAPEEALEAILGCEWESEGELLAFFSEISIELARTATQSNTETTASLYNREIPNSLSLDSPYYGLWEMAYRTNSPLLKDAISLESWDSCLDSGITWLPVIALIPLATAYEESLFSPLRDKTIKSLTSEQEEFLCYVVSMLSSGYFEGEIPTEIINAPSARVLGEIFYTWTSHRDLWIPTVVKEALLSEHADSEVKSLIATHLSNEEVEDEDSWREHLDYYWSEDDIEEVMALCE